ncbi:hypothetical protein PtrM4_028230 [Pyrenophora tritici-repentis]|uniref:Uncharacterized protein n=1 Tax=Pyrenophora tritici-repentis TaxID=45151 RepID=A0A834SB05_9PLEO|nr:hypothetical protein PtrM4_028230 [Pyrenophora tritici-repentis]
MEPTIDPYQDLLDYIEEQQDELRDARDDLVGSRSRLHTKRRELRESREKVDTQIATALDRTTRFLAENSIELPDDIKEAISKANSMREGLIQSESELEHEEEIYNLEEWRYTQKETQFVDDLPGQRPALHASSLPIPLLEMRNVDTETITQFSSGPPEPTYLPAHLDLTGPTLATTTSQYNRSQMSLNATNKNPHHTVVEAGEVAQASRRRRDTTLEQDRVSWSVTHSRIDDWLFEILSESKLEKTLLKEILLHAAFGEKRWWHLVEENWTPDTSEDIEPPTGDTVASSGSPSEPASSTPIFRPVSANSKANLSITDPLFPIDHLFDDPDSFHFPAKIEASDLLEPEAEPANSMRWTLSDRSGSTKATAMTRASSGITEWQSVIEIKGPEARDSTGIDSESTTTLGNQPPPQGADFTQPILPEIPDTERAPEPSPIGGQPSLVLNTDNQIASPSLTSGDPEYSPDQSQNGADPRKSQFTYRNPIELFVEIDDETLPDHPFLQFLPYSSVSYQDSPAFFSFPSYD